MISRDWSFVQSTPRLRRVAVPVGQAVAAEAGEVHQVDVLDVGAFAQVVDKPPERRRLEVALLLFAEFGHGEILQTGPVREPYCLT